MYTQQQLFIAIDHFLEGTATEEEKNIVNSWYHSFNDDEVIVNSSEKELYEKIELRLRNRLFKTTGIVIAKAPDKRANILTSGWVAAAAILLFLSIGIFIPRSKQKNTPAYAKTHDVAPGGNKAILTLDNGRQVILENEKDGSIANQGNTIVRKIRAGRIEYLPNSKDVVKKVGYNILSTQRGGQYHLVLPDNTQVWLNAESSVRYPTSFAGNERNVELISGEAYFEVAHDKTKPFRVSYSNQTVEVLGTHFNINAYKDNGLIRTTLLEGSIRLIKGAKSILVSPGQQAITSYSPIDNLINLTKVDTEESIAWKNGIFKFDHTDIKTVMLKLQRWYNVDVKYEGKVPDVSFEGGTYMNKNLSEVLKVLELNGVHFRLEDRTIIVYP